MARLLATLPIRHQLVAVLGNPVHLPAIDHPGLDAFTHTETITGHDVVGVPDRVVGPGLFHRAVPDAEVGPGLRIVIARHLNLPPAAVDCDSRNVAELLCAELDIQQGRVRVAQLRVDHLGVAGDQHGVGDTVVVLVRRQAPHAQLPATGGRRQVDSAGALVAGGGLAIDGLAQYLLIGAAVGGQIYGVFDPVPANVAVGVLLLERRPGEAQTHRGKLGIAQRAHPRRIAAQLDVDTGFVLNGRDARDVVLVHRSRAPLPLNVREVQVTARVHQRGVVEVDVALARNAGELALAHGEQDLGHRDRAQAVGCLDRLFRLATAALAAGNRYRFSMAL